MRDIVRLIGLSSLLVCWSHLGWAQTTQGEILGIVRDESRGVLPGADVTVTSLATGLERRTVTDAQGFYSVPHLESGPYAVSVTMIGFSQFLQKPVLVEPGIRRRVDVTLALGGLADQVVVEAVTPVIETDSGQISDSIDREHLQSIVMGGRGVFNWVQQTIGTNSGNGGLQINGSRGTSNEYTIDGVAVTYTPDGRGLQSARPDQEMLQEVRVYSVNNSAEFGKQAVVAQTTLGGTNQVRGQATYNQSNGALNARSFFATERPRGLPIHNWYVSGGGPVVLPGVYDGHDRMFFFLHYDGQDRTADNPLIRNVPTLPMRQGDLSAFPAIIDPLTGQPFPRNVIPAERLNPSALRFLERFYPLPAGPNQSVPTPNSNFNVSNPGGRRDQAWSARLDRNLGAGHSLFVRYYQSVFNFLSTDDGVPIEVRRGGEFRRRTTRSAVLSSSSVLTPTTLNEFRLGFLNHSDPRRERLKGTEIVDLIGLNGFRAPLNDAFGFPDVTISGLTGVTPSNESRDAQTQYHVVNHTTMIRGNHSLKFGGDFQYNKDSQFAAPPTLQFGRFAFDGFATGEPFADFLLGIPRTASVAQDIGAFHGSSTEWALFLQDDWRVTPTLNVN
ncbi:MAG: carboxypeptidase regulatory-like domain-containing protein, partial [Vicinamibacteraceae bacterium]